MERPVEPTRPTTAPGLTPGRRNADRRRVAVAGRDAVAVVDLDHVAVAAGIFGGDDPPAPVARTGEPYSALKSRPVCTAGAAGERIEPVAETARQVDLAGTGSPNGRAAAGAAQPLQPHDALLRPARPRGRRSVLAGAGTNGPPCRRRHRAIERRAARARPAHASAAGVRGRSRGAAQERREGAQSWRGLQGVEPARRAPGRPGGRGRGAAAALRQRLAAGRSRSSTGPGRRPGRPARRR